MAEESGRDGGTCTSLDRVTSLCIACISSGIGMNELFRPLVLLGHSQLRACSRVQQPQLGVEAVR